METFALLVAVFGSIVLVTSWLPMLIREMPLSLPIICIAIGCVLAWSPLGLIFDWNPLESRYLTERLTEFVVVVSLMGAGLKLDRPFGWRRWGTTWRLLGIAMPLTIGAVALVGWGMLGLALPTALLLGAALAPTDPVLASDVQVGPPQSGTDDDVRFSLTSEAGLNDGLAFPFVYLAIAAAVAQGTGEPFLVDWLVVDVGWKIVAGVVVGWAGGKALGFLTFRLPNRARISGTGDGLVALGVASLVYGATELVHGYGFLAVFVAAVSLRAVEREHRFHENLHNFAEQIERLFMMVLLVCFGAAIAEGSIFASLTWEVVAAAAAILFVIRPATAWLGLAGANLKAWQRGVIAFFGIRGIGSIYYVAFALGQAEFEDTPTLWVTLATVILASIVLHGSTATPVMRWLEGDSRREHGPSRLRRQATQDAGGGP